MSHIVKEFLKQPYIVKWYVFNYYLSNILDISVLSFSLQIWYKINRE